MVFSFSKGVIALDIDGTITSETHSIHPEVVHYLSSLHQKGWQFIFITGRPYQWGYAVLKLLPFPYAFAIQNGALILQIPSYEVLDRRYLNRNVLPGMEKICEEEQTDFVIYSGWDHGDYCYFRPKRFSTKAVMYLHERASVLGEKWIPVDSFDSLPLPNFSSLKCFAMEDKAFELSRRIEEELGLHVPVVRDPFNHNYFVIQATHAQATKGLALRHYLSLVAGGKRVIAAGDDYNDLSMLQEADIKVVMANAPEELLALADIIAPTAKENGIITGLNAAIEKWER